MVRADKLLDVEIRNYVRTIKKYFEDQCPEEYKDSEEYKGFLAWKEKMTEERRKAAVRT